jgi:hypothetical protein
VARLHREVQSTPAQTHGVNICSVPSLFGALCLPCRENCEVLRGPCIDCHFSVGRMVGRIAAFECPRCPGMMRHLRNFTIEPFCACCTHA